ncbi:MAG: hypothetical protein RL199_2451 [Pseudomonadota bacterium]
MRLGLGHALSGVVLLPASSCGGSPAASAGSSATTTFAADPGTTLPDTSGLPPMDPRCVPASAPEDCWNEWLKREGAPAFAPVARGALGAGPWSLDRLVTHDLPEPPVGVGIDTGENLWVVGRTTLFVRRAGGNRFESYPVGTGGLGPDPLLSVAGAGPGVAYVGHEGRFGVDPDTEPAEVRRSGDVQKMTLGPSALGPTTTFDTHNSNTPLSGKYDHSRSIFELVVPRRGPAAGELYLGTEHGVVRYRTDTLYADHRHIATLVGPSQHFGATGALCVGDDGTLWYGNDYALGGLAWTPRLYEWYFDVEWLFPTWAFGAPEDRDDYQGIGRDSQDGVWAVARGRGLAHLVTGPKGRWALETLPLPDAEANDLVVDLDDTLWLAADGGVFHGSSDGRTWVRLAGVDGPVRDLFLDDLVSPRTLWMAGRTGVSAYRGP